MAWKYQIPSIVLCDKTLNEGIYSFDIGSIKKIGDSGVSLWDGIAEYKRYQNTKNGVSPLAFPSVKDAIVKVNSYEHDESGITTEDPNTTIKMQDKRLGKRGYITEELAKYEAVKIYGNKNSDIVVLCWGSNKGVCVEVAEKLDLMVSYAGTFNSDKAILRSQEEHLQNF